MVKTLAYEDLYLSKYLQTHLWGFDIGEIQVTTLLSSPMANGHDSHLKSINIKIQQFLKQPTMKSAVCSITS